METMYLDKLDGRITQEFYEKHSAVWRREQDGLLRKIQDTERDNAYYRETGRARRDQRVRASPGHALPPFAFEANYGAQDQRYAKPQRKTDRRHQVHLRIRRPDPKEPLPACPRHRAAQTMNKMSTPREDNENGVL